MQALNNLAPVRWARVHPRLSAWLVLSLGMVVLLIIQARDVGLLIGQWLALITACVLVAGACIWIISWEDADDREPAEGAPERVTDPAPAPAAPTAARVESAEPK